MVELESSSPEETERIGAAVARELEPRRRRGGLRGARTGKTTFVRGGRGRSGSTGRVTSPSYTIGHRYQGEPDVSHLDLYRFDGMSDAEWGDLERYFEDAVVFVEWPEAGGVPAASARVQVRLRHLGEAHRLITLEASEKALEIRLSAGADPRV